MHRRESKALGRLASMICRKTGLAASRCLRHIVCCTAPVAFGGRYPGGCFHAVASTGGCMPFGA
eukprot:6321346-Prymnesium_polylepis.1